MVVRLSLDSSCLNTKKKHPILNILDELEKDGKIEIFVSTSIWREQVETQQNPEWQRKYLKRIAKMKSIYEIGFLGTMYLGHARLAGDDAFQRLIKLAQICFPNKTWETINSNEFNDVMALEAHAFFKLDFFVTLNINDFIANGKRERLSEQQIEVREPNDDFIKELEKLAN